MRFGVSSRGRATMATCTLIDMGIVNKKDPHLIIDHNKIEREKSVRGLVISFLKYLLVI